MRVSALLLSFLIACNLFVGVTHATPLRLVVPQFPPYTSESDGDFSGVGIELIEQLMLDMEIEYQLRSTPNYARALGELIRGQADGFFLASENSQRNNVAVFSEPLLINHWSWFLAQDSTIPPDSSAFKAMTKVGTIHGSNTNKWLIEHNYNVTSKANSAALLPVLLLDKKRVDAVFLASLVFRKELALHGYSSDKYIEIVEQSKPFGIYISKEYLENNPGFMEKLNSAILKIQYLE